MKITVQRLMDATITLARIIDAAPAMPQKGKYRVARMHTKLLPEYNIIDAQREAMIKAYDTHAVEVTVVDGVTQTVETVEYCVPESKLPEFRAAWKEIADQEIEVDIEPIPLSQLCLGDHENGGIEAAQLIALGSLVAE